MIKMRQFTSLLISMTMAMTSMSVYGSPAQAAEDSVEKPDSGFAPRNIRKSKKALDFEIVDEDGNKIDARFENDTNRGSISTLRSHMVDQNKELKRQADFIRITLNLPSDFYKQFYEAPKFAEEREYIDENVVRIKPAAKAGVPYLAQELLNDHAVLEYYLRLPIEHQNEIFRQYNLKYKDSHGKIFFRSFARPLNTSLHGYWAQSVMFSGVIGLMMWQQLSAKYYLNPEAMIQHLESLKDPVAHLAFYSFMVMNGFTADFLQKHFVAGRVSSAAVRSLKVAIPYIGMSAGMIASSLTHEVGTLVGKCAAHLLHPKESVLSEKDKAKKEVCDQAMDEFFNFDNKVEQYIPMLISLSLSTMGASKAQMMLGAAHQAGKNAFTSKAGQKVLGSTFAKVANEYGGKYVLRFLGWQVLARVTPAGWAMNGATVATIALNMGQIAGFLAIDHQIMPWLAWNWAQIWRASRVDQVDKQIKTAFQTNQANGWKNVNGSFVECKDAEDARNEKCQSDMRLILKLLQKQMEMWRTQNHSKFFTGIGSWSKIMNNLVQELSVSESFYKFYVEEVYRAHKFKYKHDTNIPLKPVEKTLDTNLPFRKTELFGVHPRGHGECETAEQKASGDCLDPMDMYFTHPDALVKYQMNRLQFFANFMTPFFTAEAKAKRNDKKFTPVEKMQETHEAVWEYVRSLTNEQFSFLADLVSKLKGQDPKELGQTLAELNKAFYSPLFRNDENGMELLKFIRSNLGAPNPMMAEGMVIPYVYSERHKAKFEGLSSKGGQYKHHTEYLIYQMFCGPQGSEQDKIMTFSTLFGPKLHPPTLLSKSQTGMLHVRYKDNSGQERTEILCATSVPFEKLYYSTIIDAKGEQHPFLRYLNSHIDPNILGEVTSEHDDMTSNVNTFWDSMIIRPVRNMFAFMDDKYQGLLVELVNGLQSDNIEWDKHVGYTKKQEVKTEYTFAEKVAMTIMPSSKKNIDKNNARLAQGKNTEASRSLLDSSLEEINTYLTVLGAVENSSHPEMTERSKQLVTDDTSFLKMMSSLPVARVGAQSEVVSNLNEVIARLKRVTVVEKNGKLKVSVPKNESELDKLTEKLGKSLEAYKMHVMKLKLNDYQKEVAAIALEGIIKNATSLTGYLLNIQLTNFSAMTSYDKYMKSNQNNGTPANAPAAKKGFGRTN